MQPETAQGQLESSAGYVLSLVVVPSSWYPISALAYLCVGEDDDITKMTGILLLVPFDIPLQIMPDVQ